MRKQRVKALSISRPVFDSISGRYLVGRVLSNYGRACNLMIREREIVALVGPAIGNGPLNIVLEETRVLEHVKPGSPAVFSDAQLALGDSVLVLLDGAHLWNPEVNWECLMTRRGKLARNLAAFCRWLSQNGVSQGLLGLVLDEEKEFFGVSQGSGTGVPGLSGVWRYEPQQAADSSLLSTQVPSHNQAFLTTARRGIRELMQWLQVGDRLDIRESAALLAGLGPGLTPAGDDYLVGLMAGLRLWPALLGHSGLSPDEACSILLEAAEGRTTLLSRAFLRSARQGLFGEAWHELLAELAGNANEEGEERGEAIGMRRAAGRILSSGATSGADGLAGLLSPYLYCESQRSSKVETGT
jgi:hypothetical protein